MKRVVKVKLLPTPQQASVLESTLLACNRAATEVAVIAYDRGITNLYDLRKATYADLRSRGLGSQTAQLVIKKALDAIKTRKANAKNGNYGKKDSPRYNRIMNQPVAFRGRSAQPFDARILSWDHAARSISIWTLQGRMKDLSFTGRDSDLALLTTYPIGESDLLSHRGKWYLHAVVDLPEPQVHQPDSMIGVDLGQVHLAHTSDGHQFNGDTVTARHRKGRAIRSSLQKRGTKSAKRRLKKRSGKDSRFVTNTNHIIAKTIVSQAKRTERGIALENLTGIRTRVRHRKAQRADFHSWSFRQLGDFIAYKAQAAGVLVIHVDPRNTSKQCNNCGHIDAKNRPNQATFSCTNCGVTRNADFNAALNIKDRGIRSLGDQSTFPDAS